MHAMMMHAWYDDAWCTTWYKHVCVAYGMMHASYFDAIHIIAELNLQAGILKMRPKQVNTQHVAMQKLATL